MKSKSISRRSFPSSNGVAMTPLLTPLEAAMTPAKEPRRYGALRCAREAFRLDEPADGEARRASQRQKIWVR